MIPVSEKSMYVLNALYYPVKWNWAIFAKQRVFNKQQRSNGGKMLRRA